MLSAGSEFIGFKFVCCLCKVEYVMFGRGCVCERVLMFIICLITLENLAVFSASCYATAPLVIIVGVILLNVSQSLTMVVCAMGYNVIFSKCMQARLLVLE